MISCGAAAVSTTKGRSHDTKGTAAGYGKAPLAASAAAAVWGQADCWAHRWACCEGRRTGYGGAALECVLTGLGGIHTYLGVDQWSLRGGEGQARV